MPTATSPNTNPPTAPTSHPPLPPPQTFDFLPPLHTLLSRMLLPTNNGDISSPAPSPQTNNNNNNNTTPLSPKDLATAASGITAKIQKARNAVKELPGMDMTNEELEEMIRELEAEVERLNGVEANIKKAVGDSLKMLEEKAKQDGEGEREGQEEEAMGEGRFEQGHHQSDGSRRFEHRHESDASSAATLVGDGSPEGAAALREMAVRQMEDLSLDRYGG